MYNNSRKCRWPVDGYWMCRLMRALTFYFFMKYLFIDESIDLNYYVVGGILVDNEDDLLLVYNQFKKQIMNIPLTRKQKDTITLEFKSVLLDKTYPSIKKKMLYRLNNLKCSVIYSHKELNIKLNKELSENTYIELLSKIVKSIDDDVVIVTFDNFSNVAFENRIIETIEKLDNVKSIKKDYSYNNKGLQFADNVVGVIRRKLNNTDDNHFFEIISNKVIKV